MFNRLEVIVFTNKTNKHTNTSTDSDKNTHPLRRWILTAAGCFTGETLLPSPNQRHQSIKGTAWNSSFLVTPADSWRMYPFNLLSDPSTQNSTLWSQHANICISYYSEEHGWQTYKLAFCLTKLFLELYKTRPGFQQRFLWITGAVSTQWITTLLLNAQC